MAVKLHGRTHALRGVQSSIAMRAPAHCPEKRAVECQMPFGLQESIRVAVKVNNSSDRGRQHFRPEA
jgi:hypothetical protein